MSHSAPIASLVAVFAVLEVAAAPVRFNLVVPSSSTTSAGTAAEGELTIKPTVTSTGLKATSVKMSAARGMDVEIAPGTYVVELRMPGWWLAPQLIAIRGADVVDLPIKRTGSVSGTFAGIDAVHPSQFVVRFEDPGQEAFTGEALCAIENKTFRCELPEATLDIRIGLQGHVPHYRTGVGVAANELKALGSFHFVRGASVSGRVQVEEGTLRDVRIVLSPADGAGASSSLKPADNGFFSAGPVNPGEYALTALQPGFVSVSREIVVKESMEARVREALILSKPRTLNVTVTPPTDPLAEGWVVKLLRSGPAGAEEVLQDDVPADGSWTRAGLGAGDYQLLVRPKRGPVWHYQDISINDPVTSAHVLVKAVRFVASVKLAGKPLAAKLFFNGERSVNSVPFESNEDGVVRGYLPSPADGRWLVTVKSNEPSVHATTEVIAKESADGVTRLEIALSSGNIAGRVLDEKGKPAAHALINVSTSKREESLIQVTADDEGRFDVRGLQHGSYQVSATSYMEESDSAAVALREGDEEIELELRLKPYRQWRGTVRTADGQPVRDAKVFAMATDAPIQVAYPARTDRDGHFAALTPATATMFDVHVQPRGYAYGYARRPFSDELNIVVDSRGGTLLVEFDAAHGTEPVIWHNGSAITALALLSGWQAEFENAASGKTRIRIPQMERGEYTICLMPSGTDLRTVKPAGACKTLYLAPFATEIVQLRATSTSPSRNSPP